MFKNLKNKADSLFHNKEYSKALYVYEELKRIDSYLFNRNCLLHYMWCLYRVEINIKDPFLNNTKVKDSIKFILGHSSNRDKLFQFTVFKVLKEFMKRPIYEAQKVNFWLNKLNPTYLSKEEGKQLGYHSHIEEWYLLKSEACEKLGRYIECLKISEEALLNFKRLHNYNEIVFEKRSISSIKKLFAKNTKVKHQVLFVDNGEGLIKVLFENGEEIRISIDRLKKAKVLINPDKKNNNDTISLNELKKLSDEKSVKSEYDKAALDLNSKIVRKGCEEIEYFVRLARCYKGQDCIEEALDIYQEITRIDYYNKEARDFLEIYGKGLYYKYKDKNFSGVYRDVGSPPPEAVNEWFSEETEKTDLKFVNKVINDNKY